MTYAKPEITADELTDEQLAAAIMDDSLGYASPSHAMRHVENYHDDHDSFAHCERAVSCFPADERKFDADDRGVLTGNPPGSLDKLVTSAVRHWDHLSDDKRERLREFADEWSRIEDEDELASIGVSMSYPVGGP